MARAERRPASDLGRPVLDWEQAFAYYAALPPESRSYLAVAAEFGVSVRTVEKHGRNDSWRERVRAIEAQAAAELDERLGHARAEQMAEIDKLMHASFLTYDQQLRSGQVRISAADFARLVKLMLQLHGEPGERIELTIEAAAPPQPSSAHMLGVVRALRESGALEALEAEALTTPSDKGKPERQS